VSNVERRIDWPMMDISVTVENMPVSARSAGCALSICQPLETTSAGMTVLSSVKGVPKVVTDMFNGENILSCIVVKNGLPVIFSRARASKENAALE